MRRSTDNLLLSQFLPLLLTLLVAMSAWTPGHAEAQMRCAGMPAQAAPCAKMDLPAAGLSERQVSSTLMMACCRSMQQVSMQQVSMQQVSMQQVSMQQVSMQQVSKHSCLTQHLAPKAAARPSIAARSSVAARHCLVTVRVAAAHTAAPGVSRVRWFLTAHPALAPPLSAPASPALASPALVSQPAFGTTSPLSPHSQLRQHGLRAPPAA